MSGRPFHPAFDDLPRPLAVFPLSGVLLLPGGRLPLNIFEPRYLAMVEDALGQGRMLGMIQPSKPEDAAGSVPPLYETGCVGRISTLDETDDGRLLITLTGVCRFRIAQEIETVRGYRRVVPDYEPFRTDLDEPGESAIDRDRLVAALKPYLKLNGMDVKWKAIEAAPDRVLVTSLAMICPFEPREKQALLECATPEQRAEIMTALLEMAVLQASRGPSQSRQ